MLTKKVRSWLGHGGFAAIAAIMVFAGNNTARAEEGLVLYCAVEEPWCRGIVAEFEKETGIKVSMTRKSSGETFAQVKAEAENPRGDVWFGGTGDPHLQAAEEGLTVEYKSPKLSELHDWAQAQAERSGYKTVGVYAGALGFGYNADLLAKRNLEAPACWGDLLKPEYKGEVQVANPNSSGTAYTMLATLVQLLREDQAFNYLKTLHTNVNQYTKSGSAPAKATGLGETLIGIAFQHDLVTQADAGAPVIVVSPCEGTGYEVGSMSLIKGGKNPENAKKFYEWALSPDAQKLGAANKSFQVSSNKATPVPPQAPKFETLQLIDYDFAKYGSKEERTRLLSKWDQEVSNLPK